MAKKPGEDIDDLLGDIKIPTAGEESINDLLGDNPLGKQAVAKKGREPKALRDLKGVMVTFFNKKGERITGMGTLYYVTRFNGKLHYKEASQVQILPDDWNMGDPIPGAPVEEIDELA